MHNYYSNNIIQNPNKKESRKQIPYHTPHLLSGLMSFAQSSWNSEVPQVELPISPFEKWLQEFLSNSPGEINKHENQYIVRNKKEEDGEKLMQKVIIQLQDDKVRITSYKTYDYLIGDTETEFSGEVSTHEAKSLLEKLLG